VLDATIRTATTYPHVSFNGQALTPDVQTVAGLGLAVPLIAPVEWARRTQASDQVEIARLGTDDARRAIAQAAAQAYLSIIAARQVLELNERARDTARAHAAYATDRFEGGMGSRLNQIRAQQEVSSDEVRVEAAGLAMRRAQEALRVLIAADGPVDAAEEPLFEAPADADAEALQRRAEVRLVVARETAAQRRVDDSWRDRLPTLDALFTPQTTLPPGLFARKATFTAQVLFAVPLFDSGHRKGLAREREAELAFVKAERAGLEREVRAEVRAAREAVVSSDRALTAARAASAQAAEVVRITDIVFRAGATTNLELIDAQRRARDAETEVAIAESALRRARLELLTALGRFPVI
jgi:outer membrane protein TolC